MAAFLPYMLLPYVPEKTRHPRAAEELGLHEEVEAGCFLTGHPEIQIPVGSASLGFGDERVYLFGAGEAPLGSAGYQGIVSVVVESHAAVLKRFSEARLMLLGHRFLAFRGREATDGSYVVVEWEDAEHGRHDGIFCFEGLAADNRAQRCYDAILHYAAVHRRAHGGVSHGPFSQQLDGFETRRCEACGKIHRPSTSSRQRAA